MLLNHGNVGDRPNSLKKIASCVLGNRGMTDIGDKRNECEDARKFSEFHNIDVKRHSLCQHLLGKFFPNPASTLRSSQHGTGKSIQKVYSTGKCTLLACGCSFYSRTQFKLLAYISKCRLIPNFKCPLAHRMQKRKQFLQRFLS